MEKLFACVGLCCNTWNKNLKQLKSLLMNIYILVEHSDSDSAPQTDPKF